MGSREGQCYGPLELEDLQQELQRGWEQPHPCSVQGPAPYNRLIWRGPSRLPRTTGMSQSSRQLDA